MHPDNEDPSRTYPLVVANTLTRTLTRTPTLTLTLAQVVCCQMISAGGDLLAGLGRFKGILIDEVAQASEPATIVPVSVPAPTPSEAHDRPRQSWQCCRPAQVIARGCDRLVLCGDHCQLPPSCQSREAEVRSPSHLHLSPAI